MTSDLSAPRASRTFFLISAMCLATATVAYANVVAMGGTVGRPAWLMLAAAVPGFAAAWVGPVRREAHRNLIVAGGVLSAVGLIDAIVALI